MIRNYISASQISTFLTCPLLYKKKYINGETTSIQGKEYMVYGTAIHAVLEKTYRQKIKSRVDLPIVEILEYWGVIFPEMLAKEKQKFNQDTIDTLTKDGIKTLELYMKETAPTVQPIAAEQKFEIVSEKYGITILGYIDLITEDGYVVDFKTVGASKSRMYTQNYIDGLLQLTMYSIAYRKMYGKTEAGLRIEALKRLKSGPKVLCLTTKRTNREIEQLGQLMKQMRKLIDNNLFYPNLTACGSCDFKSTCSKLCLDEVEVKKEQDIITVDLDIDLD